MNVAIVAGEASGDRQAAALLLELKRQVQPEDDIRAWGIGGSALRGVGCDIIADSSLWGTIGVAESSKQFFSLLLALRKFKRHFTKRLPDVLILVDFGAFNIQLARWVKKTNDGSRCPICYYFPPSSWRRKLNPIKLKRLADVSDIIFTPFPWSADLLNGVGANAYFLGHPLLDIVKSNLEPASFDKSYGLDSSKTVITLVPGSREHEVKHILPVMLGAAGEIVRRFPGVQFLVARADNLPRSLIEDILRREQQQGSSAGLLHLAHQAGDLLKHASSALKPPVGEMIKSLATPEGVLVKAEDTDFTRKAWTEHKLDSQRQTAALAIVEHGTLEAMHRADLVIAASGTATLESAILGTPEIIMYRGSQIMNVEYKLRRRALNITHIGLPNILAGVEVCPEFIQESANVQNIAEKALDFLLEPGTLMKMRGTLKEIVRNNMGDPGATKRTATKLLGFLRQRAGGNDAVSGRSN